MSNRATGWFLAAASGFLMTGLARADEPAAPQRPVVTERFVPRTGKPHLRGGEDGNPRVGNVVDRP